MQAGSSLLEERLKPDGSVAGAPSAAALAPAPAPAATQPAAAEAQAHAVAALDRKLDAVVDALHRQQATIAYICDNLKPHQQAPSVQPCAPAAPPTPSPVERSAAPRPASRRAVLAHGASKTSSTSAPPTKFLARV